MKHLVKIRYKLLLYGCKAVGCLPYGFLYHVLAPLIYVTIYYVARYRIRVTRTNLANSFPEKAEAELRRIERRYYRHLAEVFVDTIALIDMSGKELKRRMVIIGEAEHRREVKGKDWIAALAHYGSWEYFAAYALGDDPESESLGVYRPLHDEVFDMFYHRLRSRFGLQPVSMGLLLRYIVRRRASGGKKMGIGMIADQTPPFFEITHWFDFLHQPTAFFWGVERIALRFGMPVYFLHVRKVRRAHYEAHFEEIYDGKEHVAEYEITTRYARKLEAMIQECPELWMWSHKRWKHTPATLNIEINKQHVRN